MKYFIVFLFLFNILKFNLIKTTNVQTCLQRDQSIPHYTQSISGLKDIFLAEQPNTTRSLHIRSLAAEESSQLMGWIFYIFITEKLFYKNIEHDIVENVDLFTNVPKEELSISMMLWHSSKSINALDNTAEVVYPYTLTGRFSLYLPTRLFENLKSDFYSRNYNCSSPLQNHSIKKIFNHSEFHEDIMNFIFETYKVEPSILNLRLVGLHKSLWTVFRSKECVNDIEDCVVIVASNYESYGSCLVEMVEKTRSKVVIIWLGYGNFHRFVKQQTIRKRGLLFLNSNLGSLHVTGDYESLKMDQWMCLHDDCTWGLHPVYNALTKDIKDAAYLIEMIVRKATFTQDIINDMLVDVTDWSEENHLWKVACGWLRNNEKTWGQWFKEFPKKQPIPIMMIYPRYHHYPVNIVTRLAIKFINNSTKYLPNHDLLVINTELATMSTPRQDKDFLDIMSSGLIKGAFGSGTAASASLTNIMDSFNTVFFSYSSQVDLVDSDTADTYYTMVPEFQARFEAMIAMFKNLGWSRASFIVESRSHFYKLLARKVRNYFKRHKFKVMEEVKMNHDDLKLFAESLEDIKAVRSNILILFVSPQHLAQCLCVLDHKDMNLENNYVYFFVSGLNLGFIEGLLNNNARSRNLSQIKNSDAYKCSRDTLKNLISSVISMEYTIKSDDETDKTLLNRTFKDWFEAIEKFLQYQDFFWNRYILFDSIVAFGMGLDRYLKTSPNGLNDFTDRKQMRKFNAIMKNISFEGLSGLVKFVNMSRISESVIMQYYNNARRKIGVYIPKDDANGEQLQMFMDRLRWGNKDGKIPSDLIEKKESCNLQLISDIFNVSCNQAIVIFSFFITLIIAFLVFFLIFRIRKRLHGKSIIDPVISQKLREKWELKRDDILINRVLGHGEFGTVFGGDVGVSSGNRIPVAIKILKSGTKSEDKSSFFVEADLMKDFDHENIMKLVGVCSVGEPLMVAMEFMMFGDLRSFLLSRRHLVSERNPSDPELGAKTITRMALDVAKGLEYLIKIFCVHRDLACRNCLVHESGTVKISDFGLSYKVYDDYGTRCVNHNKIPIRWMAPECLHQGVFSFASDIWSYGILLYEIFTFGTIPYHDLTNQEVVEYIKKGRTISLPPSCSEDLVNLLQSCWAFEPADRPVIQVILEELTSKPLLLKPYLDLPKPQFDPKEFNSSNRPNFKEILAGQLTSRLSTSSNAGLLMRYRNPFARANSMQSPEKSPNIRQKSTDKKFFSFPSNIALKNPASVEARSETLLESAEKPSTKRFEMKRVFMRSVSSDRKMARLKGLKGKKVDIPLQTISSKQEI